MEAVICKVCNKIYTKVPVKCVNCQENDHEAAQHVWLCECKRSVLTSPYTENEEKVLMMAVGL